MKNVEGSIIDVGCGTGIAGAILQRHLPVNLIGVDFSRAMLRKAMSRKRIQNLIQADALHLVFRKDSVGAIVCVTVLSDYCSKDPFYKEFYSCLAEDGIYVHGDYSVDDEYWNLNEEVYPLAFSSKFKLTREDLEATSRKLADVGFNVVETKPIRFRVEMTVSDYLGIVKSRPGFKFDKQKEDQVRRMAERHLSSSRLTRELILIIGEKGEA